MANAVSAKTQVVEVSTTGTNPTSSAAGDWAEIYLTDATLNRIANMLDSTTTVSNGNMEKIQGLKDANIPITAKYQNASGQTTAQDRIIDAVENDSALHVRRMPLGRAAGNPVEYFQCIPEGYTEGGSVGTDITFTTTLHVAMNGLSRNTLS